MIDNYHHLDGNVFYICESIPGPRELSTEYDKILEDFNSQIIHQCKCDSCLEDCPCIMKNNCKNSLCKETYLKIINKQTLPEANDMEVMVSQVECNDCCTCSSSCENRLVQRGPIEGLVVRKCDHKCKGYGLFTKKCIPKGTFVCEYAGEIITKSEAEKRHSQNSLDGKINYIFCLKEFINDQILETYIDPSVFGNIGRYINHSCQPNCTIIPVRINCLIPKLAIFSNCDIPANTEITFKYGNNNNFNVGQNQSSDRKLCLCNSLKCLRYLPFDP